MVDKSAHAYKIPKTDEEVYNRLKNILDDNIVLDALYGIYICYKMDGYNLLEAYKLTIMEYAQIIENEAVVAE